MIKNLVFLLEEPSAKEMLMALLPKLLPDNITPCYMVFSGKQDLERSLVRRLRGWQLPDSAFIILRDQDGGDCVTIKESVTKLCRQAGQPNFLVRIACHELESFYLGDLQAVEKGLGITGLARRQNKNLFRTPDSVGNPSEELGKLTQGKYQKIAGSRAIGPHLDPASNQSTSFNVLLAGIRRVVNQPMV